MKVLFPPFTALVVLALLLAGCTYAISPDIAKTADRSIPFERLSAEPSRYVAKTVILGGVIARTTNLKKGTLLEIAQRDLDYWDRPQRTGRSGGRFLVLHSGTLDPLIHAPGREVTVAGDVAGEGRSADESGIPYLLLTAKELRLWPKDRPASDRPDWIDPLYDPSTQPGRQGY